MRKQALIIFTRIPEAGKTKTRLMPFLTGEECAGLHMAFLKDLDQKVKNLDADLFVAYTGGGALEAEFRNLFAGAEFFPQVELSLWDRMHQAMEFVLNQGYERCVLIGTDVPVGQKEDLEQAFQILQEKDYVFGPTEDGGYWLVGANGEDKMLKSVFSPVVSSQSTVLENTLQMIPSWKSYGLLDERFDIDTIEDLLLFRDYAEGYTKEYLRNHHVISVIVPLYNEAEVLPKFMENLKKFNNRVEVIFVDGGSTDGSVDIIRQAAENSDGKIRLLESAKSRGVQLNAGAEAANGDVLFFLHIDAELPADPVSEILTVMEQKDVGCFGIAFHSHNFFMWTNKVISNRRAAKGIVFGDQGLFIKRDVFFDAGMFPEIPIMEDFQLSMNLQKLGYTVGMTEHLLYVSDRRYQGSTIRKLKVMWHMYSLRKRYLAGESPESLVKDYPDVR